MPSTIKCLDSFSTNLLRDDIIIARASKFYKTVTKHILNSSTSLDDNALNAKSVLFEAALVKLKLSEFDNMSLEKKESIDRLRKNIEVFHPLETPEDKNLAEIAMR